MTSDEVLMLGFQAGSRQCFEELFARYRQSLHAFFSRRISGQSSAEDLAQETWVAILKGAARYEPRSLFRSYLYAIAFNILAGEHRRNARTDPAPPDSPSVLVMQPPEASRWLRQALDKLQSQDKEMIMLREYEQLSYGEIADLLQIPVNTVRSRLFRARLELKSLLEPNDESKEVRGRS